MADTLTNLVQLALGTASVIQPLLPLVWEGMPDEEPFESAEGAEPAGNAREIRVPRATGDVSPRRLPALIPHIPPRSNPVQLSLTQLLYKRDQVVDATAGRIFTDDSRTRVHINDSATTPHGEQHVALESQIDTTRPPTINTLAPDLSRATAASLIEPTSDILPGAAVPQAPVTQDMSRDQDEILERVGQVILPFPLMSAPQVAAPGLSASEQSSVPAVSPKPVLQDTHRVWEETHGRARRLDMPAHENPVQDTPNLANSLPLDIGDRPQEALTSTLAQRDARTGLVPSSLPPTVNTTSERIKPPLGEDAPNDASATHKRVFEIPNNYIQPIIPVGLGMDAADKPPSGERADTSQAAPLIRVRIGRIQVLGSRSVRQPVNQPRAVPHPPVLSLSAYLERLDGASE